MVNTTIIILLILMGNPLVEMKPDTSISSISGKKNYFFSAAGDDLAEGSIQHPFATLQKLNSLHLQPGDSVCLKGGEVFKGTMVIDSGSAGTSAQPITVTSYGSGRAIIQAGNASAVFVYKCKYLDVSNLRCEGAGRKNGNIKDGLIISHCANIKARDIEVEGFQKSGFLVDNSSLTSLTNIHAHENGSAGILVSGTNNKADCRDIYIGNCLAENNPGDPTNLTNHSGNGILAGFCSNVLIEYCTATNNGWDMPRIGNGPVGIWCYEADRVTIQHCLSYRNKTSVGGADGGGFDLDGGVTNSVIQYCLSYENQGAGYCLFQYLYASPWHDNVVRYNISENDGSVSDAGAGLYVWNSSRDEKQFYNSVCYNNTIYNKKGAAISYSELSKRTQFRFYNNIFAGRDTLIKGIKGNDVFLANDWWSLTQRFNIEGMRNFVMWARQGKQEMLSGKVVGLNILPAFAQPGSTALTRASGLKTFECYAISPDSPLRIRGLDLNRLYKMQTGNRDFNQHPNPKRGIGASF